MSKEEKLSDLGMITLAVECRKMGALLRRIKEVNWKSIIQLEDISEQELDSAIPLMDKIVNKTSTTSLI